jgi:hypothetical protein
MQMMALCAALVHVFGLFRNFDNLHGLLLLRDCQVY